MKATIHTQYGSPRVLRVEDVARPTLAEDQILVEVHASAVTQGDRRLRSADFPGIAAVVGRLMFGLLRPRNPTPGTTFAGRVVEVGESVTRFRVGDRIFGGCDTGAQAEYLALSEDAAIARIPEGVHYDEAAAIPYGAHTALQFMRDIASVQPGDRVLILGASGGVGRFAVQIARHLGAKVTGVCSGAKAQMVRELGAHEVIDYTQEDWTKNGKAYDVVFDTVSGTGYGAARRSLSENGCYASLYMTPQIAFQMLRSALFGGPRAATGVVMPKQKLTDDVAALLAEGAIWPVIGARFPLEQVADAHAALEDRETRGAVVVMVAASAEIDADPFADTALWAAQ